MTDTQPSIVGDVIESTPDPATVTLVTAALRHILTILAGLGLYAGTVNNSTLTLVASSVVGLATIGWSLWQKFQAARAAHDAAVASASKRVAVQPVAVKS